MPVGPTRFTTSGSKVSSGRGQTFRNPQDLHDPDMDRDKLLGQGGVAEVADRGSGRERSSFELYESVDRNTEKFGQSLRHLLRDSPFLALQAGDVLTLKVSYAIPEFRLTPPCTLAVDAQVLTWRHVLLHAPVEGRLRDVNGLVVSIDNNLIGKGFPQCHECFGGRDARQIKGAAPGALRAHDHVHNLRRRLTLTLTNAVL